MSCVECANLEEGSQMTPVDGAIQRSGVINAVDDSERMMAYQARARASSNSMQRAGPIVARHRMYGSFNAYELCSLLSWCIRDVRAITG